jgi:hypothetical protein
MYMRDADANAPLVDRIPAGVGFVLAVTAIATFYLGMFPGQVLSFASRSAAYLR